MIDYEVAEPLIEALLAPLQVDGVQVRGMPDRPNEKGVPTDPNKPLAVHSWFSSIPVDSGSLDGKQQAMTNRIVVEVRSPMLRGPTGEYRLPKRIYDLLHGQGVAGLGRLHFAGWQLLERGDGPNDRGYKGLMSFTVLSMAEARWG